MHFFSWKSVKSVPVIDHPLWSNAYMRREIWVIFGSGNGLSPVWRQAITWTNDDPLPWRVHVLLVCMSYNILDISDITRRAAHNTATAIVVKRWVSYWVISVVCVCVFFISFFFSSEKWLRNDDSTLHCCCCDYAGSASVSTGQSTCQSTVCSWTHWWKHLSFVSDPLCDKSTWESPP